jgi:hypothetical protein
MPQTLSEMINNALVALAANRDGNLGVYQNQVLNTYQSLLDKVTTENDMIQKSYPGISIAGQKSIYINQSTSTLSTINRWLFWIYIVVAIALCVLVIMKPYSIPFKVGIVVFILAFPFYVYPAEKLLYEISMYIYSILLSVVYNNGYGNKIPEYYVSGMENLKST